MRYNGMNMGQVKLQNRSMILQYINENGPVSRKDVADATGLTPAAVTQICTILMAKGILVELGTDSEDNSAHAGRKKVLIDINKSYANVITISIETEETVITIVDLSGKVLTQSKMNTAHEIAAKDFLEQIGRKCENCIRMLTAREQKKLAGVSVTLPGLVDREQGIASHAYGIWSEEVFVRDILEAKLHMPVMVENNVNAYAQAELLYGIGRKYDNFLLIKWGPGVGSAIVTDKHIYEGRHGKAAELGHFIVKKNGKCCACGRRGCLETEVSYQALQEIHPFSPETPESCYCKEFDPAIDLFARSIVNTITILEPNRVLLYGRLFADPQMRDSLIAACMSYESRYDGSRILYSELSGRENYIGALAHFFRTNIILQSEE